MSNKITLAILFAVVTICANAQTIKTTPAKTKKEVVTKAKTTTKKVVKKVDAKTFSKPKTVVVKNTKPLDNLAKKVIVKKAANIILKDGKKPIVKKTSIKILPNKPSIVADSDNAKDYSIDIVQAPGLKNKQDLIFRNVEQEARFAGGTSALQNYLSNNIRYPAKELENNIQGTVEIEFIVEKNGEIDGFKLLNSAGKDFDNEAMRVVKAMPKWNPALQNGVAVRSYYVLPIAFTID
jgi:TonB family protein